MQKMITHFIHFLKNFIALWELFVHLHFMKIPTRRTFKNVHSGTED